MKIKVVLMSDEVDAITGDPLLKEYCGHVCNLPFAALKLREHENWPLTSEQERERASCWEVLMDSFMSALHQLRHSVEGPSICSACGRTLVTYTSGSGYLSEFPRDMLGEKKLCPYLIANGLDRHA